MYDILCVDRNILFIKYSLLYQTVLYDKVEINSFDKIANYSQKLWDFLLDFHNGFLIISFLFNMKVKDKVVTFQK